ncbi:DUF1667 domain-containing protein [Amycolatopsis sp. Poz14]|nr:DUF1667 domain-containing protein [Amycolatopsis sp. Poz14]
MSISGPMYSSAETALPSRTVTTWIKCTRAAASVAEVCTKKPLPVRV